MTFCPEKKTYNWCGTRFSYKILHFMAFLLKIDVGINLPTHSLARSLTHSPASKSQLTEITVMFRELSARASAAAAAACCTAVCRKAIAVNQAVRPQHQKARSQLIWCFVISWCLFQDIDLNFSMRCGCCRMLQHKLNAFHILWPIFGSRKQEKKNQTRQASERLVLFTSLPVWFLIFWAVSVVRTRFFLSSFDWN